MSAADRALPAGEIEPSELRAALTRVLFRDRLGVALALATFVWVGLTWRFGFTSNDEFTFANALLAVADGRLHITDPVYGPTSGATPGTYLVDGNVYGRNYGVVIVSALWYGLLRAVALVADVRVFLAGCWSLALLGLFASVGAECDRRRTGTVVGTAVAGPVFALSLLVVRPLSTWWLPLIALQLTTALATAATIVVCYRLVTQLYDRRLGVAAAVATLVGTPVGFWATVPKRHSVTVLFVVCGMYTLYRSRDASALRAATRFRALTYVWPALLAWVHAPLGFVLLLAVAAVDVPTARSNAPRVLLTVGAAFGLALLPFLLTNALISGNPVAPPRFLSDYGGSVLGADAGTSGAAVPDAGTPGGATEAPGSDDGLPGGSVPSVGRVVGRFVGSLLVLLDPGRLFRVFVHTGYVPSLRPSADAATNLSVVESMPLLGALVTTPALAVQRTIRGNGWPVSPDQWSPTSVLDGFTVLYGALHLGLYLQSLPNNYMLTVRYLHPLYLIGVYWLVRQPAVRRVVESEPRRSTVSYAVTVLAGLPAYVGTMAVLDLVLDESVQLYAHAVLVVAAGVGIWSVLALRGGGRARTGALAVGIAAGAMSVYQLVAGVLLFPASGEFLLPVVRVISEQLHYARLAGSSPPF